MSKDEIANLFQKYGAMVYRRARYLLGSHEDAEEATQEVFLSALTHAEVFEHRGRVSTWLYRITTNHCLNRIRERHTRHRLWERHGPAVSEPRLTGPSPEGMIALHNLLAEADEIAAQVAIYVFIDGMRHREVARLIGVSRRSVGHYLERFREWAIKYLEEERGA